MTAYCREVCHKLECCPYLFGPVWVGAECPSACQTRPKHEFQLEPPSRASKNKGRKLKKRAKKAEVAEIGAGRGADESSSDEETSATPSCATTREPSRETSPDRGEAELGDIDGLPPSKRRRISEILSDRGEETQQLKACILLKKEFEQLLASLLLCCLYILFIPIYFVISPTIVLVYYA